MSERTRSSSGNIWRANSRSNSARRARSPNAAAPAARAPRAVLQRLYAADIGTVVQADAPAWLAALPADARFDVVFLDPPFATAPWPRLWPLLAAHLADEARVYVESPREAAATVPAELVLHRRMQTREADAALYRWSPAAVLDAATLAADLASSDGRPVA